MSMKTLGSLSILFAFIHFDMTAARLFDYVLTIFIMILKKTCDDFSLNLLPCYVRILHYLKCRYQYNMMNREIKSSKLHLYYDEQKNIIVHSPLSDEVGL